uniref:Regenerating islet-derived protein 4-like n=1 Tax=Pogona vitticeps TaxID=103695 RepID=A0ABM5GQ53_9SAUR
MGASLTSHGRRFQRPGAATEKGPLLCIPIKHVINADACAREWLQYQGNCYGYFESKLTWHEAEIECQSYHRGAHLASILTVAEMLVVADHISAYQAERSSVWIGLHDIRHVSMDKRLHTCPPDCHLPQQQQQN